MISAETFIHAAHNLGFTLYAGVPCSYLKPFINYVIDSAELTYVGAANEGDAVAIAAGAALSGRRSVAMFQNSGLGNAVNPLTSLTYTFKLPILLIPTLRGEPNGPADEPQHALMGGITTQLLDLMQIPWAYFPNTASEVNSALEKAVAYMDRHQRPYALVMKKGTVEDWPLRSTPQPKTLDLITSPVSLAPKHTRHEILKAIQQSTDNADILIATTGYTGRELYACDDRHNQFYMVGSMGCAASFGLGLALVQPQRRIIVIDGDGALLMRMGVLTTIGYTHPANLIHIVLDNERHESTGGQSTVSHSVDFCTCALACGYQTAERLVDSAALMQALQQTLPGPRFIHIKIKAGIPAELPRPSISPEEVAQRLRNFIEACV